MRYNNYIKTNQTTMFYIARNSLAVTRPMTKKRCLELWEANKADDASYTLCKETGKVNPTVVMELN